MKKDVKDKEVGLFGFKKENEIQNISIKKQHKEKKKKKNTIKGLFDYEGRWKLDINGMTKVIMITSQKSSSPRELLRIALEIFLSVSDRGLLMQIMLSFSILLRPTRWKKQSLVWNHSNHREKKKFGIIFLEILGDGGRWGYRDLSKGYSDHHINELNKIIIVMISKLKISKTMKYFRPNNLCNMIYKIISNCLTERLKGAIRLSSFIEIKTLLLRVDRLETISWLTSKEFTRWERICSGTVNTLSLNSIWLRPMIE